jgi:hypothetical protein
MFAQVATENVHSHITRKTWWCVDLIPVPFRNNGQSMLPVHKKNIVVTYDTSLLTFLSNINGESP